MGMNMKQNNKRGNNQGKNQKQRNNKNNNQNKPQNKNFQKNNQGMMTNQALNFNQNAPLDQMPSKNQPNQFQGNPLQNYYQADFMNEASNKFMANQHVAEPPKQSNLEENNFDFKENDLLYLNMMQGIQGQEPEMKMNEGGNENDNIGIGFNEEENQDKFFNSKSSSVSS